MIGRQAWLGALLLAPCGCSAGILTVQVARPDADAVYAVVRQDEHVLVVFLTADAPVEVAAEGLRARELRAVEAAVFALPPSDPKPLPADIEWRRVWTPPGAPAMPGAEPLPAGIAHGQVFDLGTANISLLASGAADRLMIATRVEHRGHGVFLVPAGSGGRSGSEEAIRPPLTGSSREAEDLALTAWLTADQAVACAEAGWIRTTLVCEPPGPGVVLPCNAQALAPGERLLFLSDEDGARLMATGLDVP